MKKLVALVLTAGLLLTCISALAEQPTLTDNIPIDIPYGEFANVYSLDMHGLSGKWTSFWYDDGQWNFDNSETAGGPFGFDTSNYLKRHDPDAKIPWAIYVAGEGFETIKDANYSKYFANNGNPFVRIFRDEDMEKIFAEIESWFIIDEDGTVSEKTPIVWYPNNTICVGGLEFRQEKPSLTNKWYNFAAIDLSEDGSQVFELVASNKYVIGAVFVMKDGDEVTINWALNTQGTNDANFQLESEFLTIFHDIDSVNSVEPSEIATSFEFGKPISIANDLDGDTNVLLYIRNVATYCNNLSYKYQNPIFHPNFDRNVPFRVAYQEEMRELMKMELQ